MLRRRRSKRLQVCLAVIVLLSLHWTQTEASPVKKHIKQQEGKEVRAENEGFQPGVIVFEENKSASADAVYQADSPGFSQNIKGLFDGMNPELLCGANQMRFSASGSGVGHFTLKHKPPLPLSQIPPACSYTIEGFPHRLVLHVPYDGCNIDVVGGFFNFPMFWKGHTVKLMCPKPPSDPTPTWWPWPWLTPPTTPAPSDPTPPFPPWWPWYPWVPPPTTTPAPADPVPPFPNLPLWYYWYLLKYHHNSFPHHHPWLYYWKFKHGFPTIAPSDPPQLLPWLPNPPPSDPPQLLPWLPPPPSDPPQLLPWFPKTPPSDPPQIPPWHKIQHKPKYPLPKHFYGQQEQEDKPPTTLPADTTISTQCPGPWCPYGK